VLRPTGGWGYNSDTEILFPLRVVVHLKGARGREWDRLIEAVMQTEEGSLERLAFSLLFVRMSGCLTCHADSYRAMRGCTVCAMQTIRRFRGDDAELIALYERAKEDVGRLLHKEQRTRKASLEG
jgi:hypothetical protein